MNFWEQVKARVRLPPEYCHLCEDFINGHSPYDHFPCVEYKAKLMNDLMNGKQSIPLVYYKFWLVNKA